MEPIRYAPASFPARSPARARERAIARFLDVISRDALLRARLRGREPTVHRVLVDASGRVDAAELHRIVEQAADLPDEPQVLDAGCGLGDMMIDIAVRRGGSWTGLTFSPIQAERARAAAQARGLIGAVAVHLRAPDDPPGQQYDAVFAVECLLRCPNAEAVLTALGRTLRPGGRLVLVEHAVAASAAAERRELTRLLRAPALADEAGWRARLAASGLAVRRVVDLTGQVPARSVGAIERLAVRLMTGRRYLPLGDFRRVVDARIGALKLERLLREGRARYLMMVAVRSD
ncbi:cyclopropane-fatty-acyl-phospholipid synthase family protein [Elioraea sp.]|uniref:SAM-dependent methyltransferase n=1 Tax=Elioraea sp. TaxID=2185103 RepID=UPI0025C10111|nr:methyltransferase domain-containing protein [Elioraea sp.]